MIHNKFRYLLTLVALFAISTGAWATDETPLLTIESKDYTSFTSGSMTFDDMVTVTFGSEVSNYGDGDGWTSVFGVTLTVTPVKGITITRVKFTNEEGSAFDETAPFEAVLGEGGPFYNAYMFVNGNNYGASGVTKIEVYGTAEPPIKVTPVAEPAANTKQWTFSMPGSDVVLTPQYAPVAKWVVEGEGDNAKTLLPTAAENIIAGTTDPIIVEGTVATSTYGEGDGAKTIDQGTVMYAVTETNTTAPALTAYSYDVPTAAIVEGAVSEPTTRYVWYYIQGADTPAEEEATDKNTFNNSEVCATPLTVTLLPNVFNLVLKPTKANDITVEVNEVDKTLELIHNATENEDTLKAVKMQSEVKIKAKTGYKFKTIEVKKADGGPALNLTNPAVGQLIGDDGKNYAYASLPSGVTAVALICYVNGNNGLALAMSDEEGKMSWSDAVSTCEAHTAPFINGTWKLATVEEWNWMVQAVGGIVALRDGFSAVGGTNMLSDDFYWSSTGGPSTAQRRKFSTSSLGWGSTAKTEPTYVRACLAW